MSSNLAVIIGRFQILQRGHGTLLQAALALAPKVLIVIGSAFRARDAHNPFTWEERKQQFEAVLSVEQRQRVEFLPVRDYFDDQRWGDAVRAGLERVAGRGAQVTLVGFKKDRTSGYLDAFPGWTVHEVEPQFDISASDLRRVYFETTKTSAALTVIGNYVDFPEVVGSDDAKLAKWIPIAQLPSLEPQLFEDHASILDHFLGLYPAP